MSALAGFTGSRILPVRFRGLVAYVVKQAQAEGLRVAVGCARGADAFVRATAPDALIFSVAAGRFGYGRAAFARRSAALVQAVSASGPGARFYGFPVGPCPTPLIPSPKPRDCFAGFGSGTWSTLALAAGKGLPVTVFILHSATSPPEPWGSWQFHSAPVPGVLAATLPTPQPVQLSLF